MTSSATVLTEALGVFSARVLTAGKARSKASCARYRQTGSNRHRGQTGLDFRGVRLLVVSLLSTRWGDSKLEDTTSCVYLILTRSIDLSRTASTVPTKVTRETVERLIALAMAVTYGQRERQQQGVDSLGILPLLGLGASAPKASDIGDC